MITLEQLQQVEAQKQLNLLSKGVNIERGTLTIINSTEWTGRKDYKAVKPSQVKWISELQPKDCFVNCLIGTEPISFWLSQLRGFVESNKDCFVEAINPTDEIKPKQDAEFEVINGRFVCYKPFANELKQADTKESLSLLTVEKLKEYAVNEKGIMIPKNVTKEQLITAILEN